MTSETGMMNECYKFAKNHNLPIRFIMRTTIFPFAQIPVKLGK